MAYDFYSDFEGYEMMDDQYSYDMEEMVDGSVNELIEHCILPTLQEMFPNILNLFIVCFIFRLFVLFSQFYKTIFPLSSIAFGVYILQVFFQNKVIHVITVAMAGYFLLKTLPQACKSYRGYIIGICLLIYLFLGEFIIVKYDAWETIRGTQMIVSMKILSYTFDSSSGAIKEINALDYFGYIFCPGNCVFGPWVSYNDYKNIRYSDNFNANWFIRVIQSIVLSVLFFMASVCVIEWLISDDSSLLWIVYRNALLYRVGHYFVSFVSEVSLLLSGFGQRNGEIYVVKPLSIELPYSLVQVVVNWNIPMHKWLKTYIFKTTLPLGGFPAVMITYLVSALLHGFNIRLAAVLLSLGIYTYVEHSLRHCLSGIFDACISSKPCTSSCVKHKRTTRNLVVHMVNVFFMAVAIFHLAYLGVLIHIDNKKHITFDKAFKEWIKLNFISHWVVLATFVVHVILYFFL